MVMALAAVSAARCSEAVPRRVEVFLPVVADVCHTERGVRVQPAAAVHRLSIPVLFDDTNCFTTIEGTRFPLVIKSYKDSWSGDIPPLCQSNPRTFYAISYHLGWSQKTQSICVYKVPFRSEEHRYRYDINQFYPQSRL